MLSLKRFQCWSNWRWAWLFLVLSRTTDKRSLFLYACPSPLPDDRWCHVLGFMPAGSVSGSSTLPIFRDARHLWWLFCSLSIGTVSFLVFSMSSRTVGYNHRSLWRWMSNIVTCQSEAREKYVYWMCIGYLMSVDVWWCFCFLFCFFHSPEVTFAVDRTLTSSYYVTNEGFSVFSASAPPPTPLPVSSTFFFFWGGGRGRVANCLDLRGLWHGAL